MFELKAINVINKTRVEYEYEYEYECNAEIEKFFSRKTLFVNYDVDVTLVPKGILAIPLLSNILPISWFAGFDIKINELDSLFYQQVLKLKKQFSEFHPLIKPENSSLVISEIIEYSNFKKGNSAMLFSGGLDAYTTLLRHYEETPDLITIKGVDIDINDHKQWEEVLSYVEQTEAIKKNSKFFIESNVREFITFEVDKLLPNLGWWGKVQHGLALTCLTAPLAYINGYNCVYIASSRSVNMPFTVWGSMPEIDDLVQFSSTKIKNDGYAFSRLDKVELLMELSEKYELYPQLRACYHDEKDGLNCNICEKCLRTIFAILIKGKNPNLYGFKVEKNFYNLVLKYLKNGFDDEGKKLYWNELFHNINQEFYFYIYDKESEILKLNSLKNENVNAQKNEITNRGESKIYVMKMKIIKNYPKLFKFYLKIRRSFI